MSRPRKSIESFGNELLVVLVKGGREELRIPFPSYRTAIYFRNRLHALRAAMQRDTHPLYPVVAKTRISILFGAAAGEGYPEVEINPRSGHPKDRNTKCLMYLRPQDSDFGDILQAAGISRQEINDDLLAPHSKDKPPEVLADEFLDSLGYGTGNKS